MNEKPPFHPDLTNPDIRPLLEVKEKIREVDEELRDVQAEYGGLVLEQLHFQDLSLEGVEVATGNKYVIPFKDLDLLTLHHKPQ